MWPFKKDEIVKKTPPIRPGEKFKYLGIEMICTRDWYKDFDAVVADYVDERGTLKTWIFFPCDWDALKTELAANNEVRGGASSPSQRNEVERS